jgi:hypothetical protein
VLWALGQPAAAIGLIGAFVLGPRDPGPRHNFPEVVASAPGFCHNFPEVVLTLTAAASGDGP